MLLNNYSISIIKYRWMVIYFDRIWGLVIIVIYLLIGDRRCLF